MEDTETNRKRRRFDAPFYNSSPIFKNTRHNLLADFDQTPTREIQDSGQLKSSFSKFLSPETDDSSILKKELRLKDADIISLKAKITKLEKDLKSADLASRKAQLEYDKNVTKFRSEKEHEATKVGELRSKLQYVMEKDKGARDEISRLERELMNQKMELEKKLMKCRIDLHDAKNSVDTWRSKYHAMESDLQDQGVQQKREVSSLQSQWEEARAQLQLKDQRLAETSCDLEDVHALRDQVKELQDENKSLSQQLAEHKDNMLVTRALKADLDCVPKLRADLDKLREQNEQLRYNEQNCLLLEEDLRSFKKKLEFAESRSQKVTELEVENEELKARLGRWELHDTSGSRRPQSPSSLCQRVTEMETSLSASYLKQGELQTQIHSLTTKLEHAEADKVRLISQVAGEKAVVTQHSEALRRLRRKELLITKERDSYKSLLDSYESEVTMNFDSEKQKHMQRQEESLQAYRREVDEKEAEISRLAEQLTRLQSSHHQVKNELQTLNTSIEETSSKQVQESTRELRDKVAALETQLLETQGQKDILEARIEQRHLQGDYDPSKTKILHFSFNPAAQAQQARQEELANLREEVDKLRKRNEILEAHGGSVEDITMQVDQKLQQPSPSKELQELKSQVKKEEMRNQRLKEVFKKTSQDFREICYQLTGYKIDIPLFNQYRLTNMYAESSKDYLLFQQNDQGEIQMLETDYLSTLRESMETYLQKANSIPVFLSSITMELYGRQTLRLDCQ